jgi:hypothetical protein
MFARRSVGVEDLKLFARACRHPSDSELEVRWKSGGSRDLRELLG